MQRSSEQPLVGEERYVTTLITAAKETKASKAHKFSDEKDQSKFTCPVCLDILYRPKSIKNSDPKHVFCKSCIDELTRTSKSFRRVTSE